MLIFWVVLGWFSGMLINYLSDVLPVHDRLTSPTCRHCQAAQGWLRHLLLPLPCSACGRWRGLRAWLVPLLMVAAGVWVTYTPSERLGPALSFAWITYFLLVTVIDLEHHLVLRPVSIAGALLGLLSGWLLRGPLWTLVGGLAGFAIMAGFHWLGLRVAAWLRRRHGESIDPEGLGSGDVTLSAINGLLLGWPGIVGGLLWAALLGGAYSLLLLLWMALRRDYQPGVAIAYGPFLCAGVLVILFF